MRSVSKGFIFQNKKTPIMTTVNKLALIAIIQVLLNSILTTSLSGQVIDSAKTNGPEVKTFYSKILGEKRKITIQTPSRMSKYDTYPVLYLLDGEVQASLVNGQVQYLSEGYRIIPNLIVVAIQNTDRIRDLTPTHSIIGPDGRPDTSANAFGKNSGGGEKFLQFIREELMPYVDSHYHTAPYKILAGHSLGGLMAVHCLINHPDYFNAYIAISPSLQWDNAQLLKQADSKVFAKDGASKVLFFSDANEDSAFHQNQLVLESILKKKNIAGLKFQHVFYPEESHTSEPVKAFYDGIRMVYPDWYLPYNNSAFKKSMNAEIIKNHFESLSKSYGYEVKPPHDDLIQISRFLRNDPNRINDAIKLLEINVANYPSSGTAFETLGDTWSKAGDAKNAQASYRKALLLDPENESVKQKLKTITQ